MKRFLTFIIIAATVLSLVGCGSKPAAATAKASTSAVVSAAPTDTTVPQASVSPTADDNTPDDVKTYDGYTYYLDTKDSAVVDYNEDPMLHRKKADGSANQALNVRGFNMDIIGDYIYLDSYDADLGDNGARIWSTTRVSPDGATKTKLEYGCMSLRHVKDDEKKFYFTTMGDSAIYVSDYACENVTVLAVKLPDESELNKKLDKDNSLQLDINDVSGGQINFDATFSTSNGIELYNGTYQISEDGKTIKKIKGAYISKNTDYEAD